MGLSTAIEWTNATWNPWRGCTKVSPACANCYMFPGMKRFGKDPTVVTRAAPSTFRLPLKTKKGGGWAIPSGWKVFTCSWSDWFHESADAWRPEAWEIIRQRPDVTFQIVTKRTERIRDHLPADWGNGWPNVWLIATVENQEYADKRIPELLNVPAVVHGLSMEPLLGQVFIPRLIKLKWVITGGESGPGARPSHPSWFRSIMHQCRTAGVDYFHKQNGDWTEDDNGTHWLENRADGEFFELRSDEHAMNPGVSMIRIGKKAAGRKLDGVEYSEFPSVSMP